MNSEYKIKTMFASIYKRKVTKIYIDFDSAIKTILRKPNQKNFWEKDLSLHWIYLYKNGKRNLFVQFENDIKGKYINIYYLTNNSLSDKVLAVKYHLGLDKFMYSNNSPQADYLKTLIKSIKFKDKLDLDVLNKEFVVLKRKAMNLKIFKSIYFDDSIQIIEKIHFLKLTIDAMNCLKNVDFMENELPNNYSIKLKFTPLDTKIQGQFSPNDEVILINSLVNWKYKNLGVTLVHEISHHLYAIYSNNLIKKDPITVEFFKEFQDLSVEKIIEIKNNNPEGNLQKIQNLSTLDGERIQYLLNVNEIFARSLEYKYYSALGINNKFLFEFWYFTDNEQQLLLNLREEFDNFLLKEKAPTV